MGIVNLKVLINSMSPELKKEKFCFVSLSRVKFKLLNIEPTLFFNEKEGITIIITKDVADKLKLNYSSTWAQITLNINSDLNAIGFLSIISNELAKMKIPLNVVSAYYHDHLFVPFEKSKDALNTLRRFAKTY